MSPTTAPFSYWMYLAQDQGRMCGCCGQTLDAEERVTLCSWRHAYGGRHSGRAPVCDRCMVLLSSDSADLRVAGPPSVAVRQERCEACGRPVALRPDPRRRRIYCSRRCHWYAIRMASQGVEAGKPAGECGSRVPAGRAAPTAGRP